MKNISENKVKIDLSELIIFLTGKNLPVNKLRDIRKNGESVTFIFDEDIKKSRTTEELTFLETKLEDLDISVRAYNFLKSIGGIEKAEDILCNSEKIRVETKKGENNRIQIELRLLFKRKGFILFV